jgi:glycosyltransferase involved in cell wall biosynthesis
MSASTSPTAPDLSAVVLCYRAGESVARVIEPLDRELAESGVDYELVLVANYWPADDDPTPEVVERYRRANVTIVKREKQGAMGWDMHSGLEAASGDVIVVIDGDAQNPTEDVLKMYRLIRQSGMDVMKGVRIARFDNLYRRLVSVVYNFLFRAMFGTTNLWDINGKPKAVTRSAYERMDLRSDDWFADAEIILEAMRNHLQIGEMPVVFRRNSQRASFVRVSSIVEFIWNMVRYRMTRWR